MKTGKKILALLLATALAVSMLSVPAFADLTGREKEVHETYVTPDGVTLHYSYLLTEDGKWYTNGVDVDKVENVLSEFIFPDEIEGHPISSIGPRVFQGQTGLTKVVLPKNLYSIQESAFEGCTGLTSISIPDHTHWIGGAAFAGCTRLTSVVLGKELGSLGGFAFANCSSLRSIHLPAYLSIGSNPFVNTPLETITIDPANKNLFVQDGVLFDRGYNRSRTTLIYYPSQRSKTSYVIPSGVVDVEENAFAGCSLREISIPEGVEYFDLSNCNSLATLAIPGSVESFDLSNCARLAKVTIAEGVESMGDFKNCTSLTEISIPKSMIDLGWSNDFDGCNALKTVYYAGSQIDAEKNLDYALFCKGGKYYTGKDPLFNAEWVFAEGSSSEAPDPAGKLEFSIVTHVSEPKLMLIFSAAIQRDNPWVEEQFGPSLCKTTVSSKAVEDAAQKLAAQKADKTALEAEFRKISVPINGKTVCVVAEPRVDMIIREVVMAADTCSIHLGIRSGAGIYSTTGDIATPGSVVTEGLRRNTTDTTSASLSSSFQLTIPLPASFIGSRSSFYVSINGKELSAPVALKDGAITITINGADGLSEVKISSASNTSTASSGGTTDPTGNEVALISRDYDFWFYPTLQAAVDDVEDGEQIDILTDKPISATVNRAVRFRVAVGAELINNVKNVSIKAGAGYTMVSYAEPEHTGYKDYTFSKTDKPEDPAESTWECRDVPSGHWAEEPVKWAVANGITQGTGPDTFSPDDPCTRGQIVTFLWRAAGSPEPKGESNPFADVKEGEYYYKAVLWAVENEITSGTSETTFAPSAKVSRSQTVAFLYRAAGSPPTLDTSTGFSDVNEDAWYAGAIQWAVANEITNGVSDTSFGPEQSCTRGQIVTFLYRNMAD